MSSTAARRDLGACAWYCAYVGVRCRRYRVLASDGLTAEALLEAVEPGVPARKSAQVPAELAAWCEYDALSSAALRPSAVRT